MVISLHGSLPDLHSPVCDSRLGDAQQTVTGQGCKRQTWGKCPGVYMYVYLKMILWLGLLLGLPMPGLRS